MDHTAPHADSVIGATMRRRRADQGLTLHGLARKLKSEGRPVSVSQLSKIERGIYTPRENTAKAIADGLGITVAELHGDAVAARS